MSVTSTSTTRDEVSDTTAEEIRSIPAVELINMKAAYGKIEALKTAIEPSAPVLHKPFGARELAAVVDRNIAHPHPHAA